MGKVFDVWCAYCKSTSLADLAIAIDSGLCVFLCRLTKFHLTVDWLLVRPEVYQLPIPATGCKDYALTSRLLVV